MGHIRIYRLIIIAFLVSGCSAMEVATNAALIVDHSQTVEIAERTDKYERYNFVLGEQPSVGRVNSYFGSVILLNTLIHREWKFSPRLDRYRKKLLPYYQGGLLSLEFKMIHNNYSIGVSGNF